MEAEASREAERMAWVAFLMGSSRCLGLGRCCSQRRPQLLRLQGRNPSFKTEDEPPGATRKPLVFRVDKTTPEVVQSVLLERGWDKFNEQERNVEDWNLYWRSSSFRMIEHINVKPWQRLNHHPGTITLTRKDRLARHLQRMRRMYGTALYEFVPETFIMPSDYTKFMAAYFKEKQAPGTKHGYWICKPAKLSRGRGIMIFSDIKDLVFSDAYIVQKYICNPLLVGRYKCDLRLYVCVTRFKPLTIYVYQEGLVRFATEKFDLHDLKNYYAHLTNSSINKSGVSYEKIKEVVGRGCKWTLSRFLSYLRNGDVDDLLLWQKINHVVILTVLAMAPSVPFAANCFELFGFDILIDDNLKPWLLEVNHSPALSLDCPTDVSVKRKLIHDIIELICLNGLRSEGKDCRKAASGSPDLFSRGARRGRGGPHAHLPYGSLLRFTGRTHSRTGPATETAVSSCPTRQRTPRLRKTANRQKDVLLPTREAPRIKAGLRGRRTPGSTLIPYVSLLQSHPCKTKSRPSVPNEGPEPDPHAGNFVLVFPFNEATLGASRNGLNVRRIIQELQKLGNKQPPQAPESGAKWR